MQRELELELEFEKNCHNRGVQRAIDSTHTQRQLDNIEERIETGFTIFFGFCLRWSLPALLRCWCRDGREECAREKKTAKP